AAQEVVGDPEQPGSGAGPAGVVAAAAAQRLGEGLCRQVVCQLAPDPAMEVAAQVSVVPVEELGELFGVREIHAVPPGAGRRSVTLSLTDAGHPVPIITGADPTGPRLRQALPGSRGLPRPGR